ncbi:LOW QUALITY PROTEIN: OTU domain-containing protein 4 [Pholidichthys leucotaenia]
MELMDERGAEKLMDDYLKSIGLHRKKIAKDGSCLFRAVAEQVLHCQNLHTKVRENCVEYLRKNRHDYEAFIEGDFDDYLLKLQDPQQWVGEVEINALAAMYKRDFLIEPGKPAVNITDKKLQGQVFLCFMNGNHYDSVYPINHIKNAAICQSILYELLYDRVFKVDRSALGPCRWISRPMDPLSDDNMAECKSSDESDLDASEALWVENGTGSTSTRNQSYRSRGRGRFLPERVRRSLNPTLLRNVEYDVWNKTKRAQQKMDYSIAAGLYFAAGDRCQVRLENNGKIYNATVKEVPQNNSSVTVYIPELGTKQVPLWTLQHPNDDNTWSTVVHRDKRLSNGHAGDWEERGRGRGRGRSSLQSSSSVTQATAPGSGGRGVIKQNSWPPQSTSDEQGGAKISRKSSTEVAFGLTKAERLAKEEEERNVALVEIQLRDEHSFPALGTQPSMSGDGGRKKGGEKKRSLRSKMKSPVEEGAGDRPKSSTPPLTSTTPDEETPPTISSAPADPTRLASVKPSASTNMATPAPVSPAQTSLPSYASAAGSSCSPPPLRRPVTTVVPTSKTPGAPTPGAPSVSTFSCLPAVLPSSSVPPPSSTTASPPPSSPSAPTFIAPIAPCPTAVLSFHRSSSPLPHSPSPPPPSSSILLPAKVQEAPPAPPPTTRFSPVTEAPPMASQPPQTPVTQEVYQPRPPSPLIQTQSPASVPQNPVPAEPQSSLPHPQPHPEESVLPQTLPPPQSEVQQQQVQSHPPHPSPALTESTGTQEQPPQHPQLETPAAPPPQPQFIPGAPPLQQLPQLYQDPLYPGFPQMENGSVALAPNFSNNKSGDDLPQDINILRFFFNLGIKAYTMHMVPPYFYLLPLQHAYSLQQKASSRSPSPSPHYTSSDPPAKTQEVHPIHRYPPVPQYSLQPPLDEPPRPSEPQYPVAQPQTIPYQQVPAPRSLVHPTAYPSPPPPYQPPPPSSQGYHPGHPMYPPSIPQPPLTSLGYQSSSGLHDLQASPGPMQQLLPANMGSVRLAAPLENPVAANVANSSGRPMGVQPNYAFKNMMVVDPPLDRPMVPLGSNLLNDGPMKPSESTSSSSVGSASPYRGSQNPPSLQHLFIPMGTPEHSQRVGPYFGNPVLVENQSVGCSTEDDWDLLEGLKPLPQSHHRGQRRGFRGRGRGTGRGGQGSRKFNYNSRYGPDMGVGQGFVLYNSSSSYRGRGNEGDY